MKSKEAEDFVSGTYTWEIDHFSQLNIDKHYSDVFVIGGFKWRILIRSKWLSDPNTKDQFSLYLGVADASVLPAGWVRYAHFTLTVVNQLDTMKSLTKPARNAGTVKLFGEHSCEWGFKSFMPLSQLCDSSAGYLVDDTCIVKLKVDVPYKVGDEGSHISANFKSSKREPHWEEPTSLDSVQSADCSPVSKTPCPELMPSQDTPGSEKVCTQPTDDGPTEPSLANELGEAPTSPTTELMEFKDFGLIEKDFVPLLEEVCSFHPSLIDCLHKRSLKLSQCALTALGELLHFLKTTKAKDMSEDACAHLRSLWEDVEMFKFDLTWLKPYVESALDMKKSLERARRVKRLREDVNVYDNEMRRRTVAIDITKADLEVAKRDLEKEEAGFVEVDFESELGYGM